MMRIKDYSREFLIIIYNENTTIIMEKILPDVYSYYLYFVIDQEISNIF